MRKLSHLVVLAVCVCLFACDGKKDSAESIAKQWCELNSKVAKALKKTWKKSTRMIQLLCAKLE